MSRLGKAYVIAVVATFAAVASANAQDHHSDDSAFARLQTRGAEHMGVDQQSSTHRFEDLPDGGRIVLVRDPSDIAGVQMIRAHLEHIAAAFADGDFSLPMLVHAREVPGTDEMRRRRARIRYEVITLHGGGAVRMMSADSAAVTAIHRFLAFQRAEHRTGD